MAYRRQASNRGHSSGIRTDNNTYVFIQGLPENITSNALSRSIHQELATKDCGSDDIVLFPPRRGFASAKIRFATVADADAYIREQNNVPLRGYSNRLSVKKYEMRTGDGSVSTRSTRSTRSNESFSDDEDVDKLSVHIQGIPARISEDEVFRYFNGRIDGIDKFPNGSNKVVCLRRHNDKAIYKITFINEAGARRCLRMNGSRFKHLPDAVMAIEHFREHDAAAPARQLSAPLVLDRHSNKPVTIVRNVLYVQGLSKQADVGDIMDVFDVVALVKKVVIYRHEDGKSQGRGIITFANPADAQRCINLLDGTPYPGLHVDMKITLFESTKIKRRSTAEREPEVESRQRNYAYDCIVCFETWDERDMIGCVPVGKTKTDEETHHICHECVQNHAKSLTLDGQMGTGGAGLPCGTPDCKRVTLWAPVRRLLDAKTISLLEKRIDEAALRDVDGIEYCKACPFGLFIEQNKRQMQFFVCLSPTCGITFCRKCFVNFAEHEGRTCDEVDPRKLHRARLEYEERLTAAVVRICPQCKTQFQKLEGCNKMTCQNCRLTMCYLCRATGIGYDHFNRGTCTTGADAQAFDNAQLERLRNEARLNNITRALADRL